MASADSACERCRLALSSPSLSVLISGCIRGAAEGTAPSSSQLSSARRIHLPHGLYPVFRWWRLCSFRALAAVRSAAVSAGVRVSFLTLVFLQVCVYE